MFVYEGGVVEALPVDGMSCTTVRMLAKRPGHTVVKASYSLGKVNLMATVTIAAFDPLLVSGQVLVVLSCPYWFTRIDVEPVTASTCCLLFCHHFASVPTNLIDIQYLSV